MFSVRLGVPRHTDLMLILLTSFLYWNQNHCQLGLTISVWKIVLQIGRSCFCSGRFWSWWTAASCQRGQSQTQDPMSSVVAVGYDLTCPPHRPEGVQAMQRWEDASGLPLSHLMLGCLLSYHHKDNWEESQKRTCPINRQLWWKMPWRCPRSEVRVGGLVGNHVKLQLLK